MSDQRSSDNCARAYKENPTQKNRDRVVFATEPVIRSIISRITRPADDLARPHELFNVGVIAVLQALDLFDPAGGARFVTFAFPRIRGEIIDFLRRLDPLPRRRRAKVAQAWKTQDRLAQARGREPGEFQVAEALNVEIGEYRMTRVDTFRRHQAYLFAQFNDDEPASLIDILADADARESFEAREWDDVSEHLARLSKELTDRDRTILDLCFGEDLTLGEIALFIGLSEARVSQLRMSALKKLSVRVDEGLRRVA